MMIKIKTAEHPDRWVIITDLVDIEYTTHRANEVDSWWSGETFDWWQHYPMAPDSTGDCCETVKALVEAETLWTYVTGTQRIGDRLRRIGLNIEGQAYLLNDQGKTIQVLK